MRIITKSNYRTILFVWCVFFSLLSADLTSDIHFMISIVYFDSFFLHRIPIVRHNYNYSCLIGTIRIENKRWRREWHRIVDGMATWIETISIDSSRHNTFSMRKITNRNEIQQQQFHFRRKLLLIYRKQMHLTFHPSLRCNCVLLLLLPATTFYIGNHFDWKLSAIWNAIDIVTRPYVRSYTLIEHMIIKWELT